MQNCYITPKLQLPNKKVYIFYTFIIKNNILNSIAWLLFIIKLFYWLTIDSLMSYSLYNVHCIMYSVHCTMYVIQFTMFIHTYYMLTWYSYNQILYKTCKESIQSIVILCTVLLRCMNNWNEYGISRNMCVVVCM